MSKYTSQQVVTEKRCGIKHFDEAVAKIGREALVEETIKISREHPGIWGEGWPNVDWALGNAVIDTLNKRNEFSQTYNLDEVLTTEELQKVATDLQLTDPYTQNWERRKPKKVV
jgi:hypothetical protein